MFVFVNEKYDEKNEKYLQKTPRQDDSKEDKIESKEKHLFSVPILLFFQLYVTHTHTHKESYFDQREVNSSIHFLVGILRAHDPTQH